MTSPKHPDFWAFADAVSGLGWHVVDTSIRATFETGSFARGVAFVNRIAGAAEQAEHHPDVALTYPSVEVTLTSHDVGTLSTRDVALAEIISQIAHEDHIVVRDARA